MVVLGAGRVASAPGPCPWSPLPALGVQSTGPHLTGFPHCAPFVLHGLPLLVRDLGSSAARRGNLAFFVKSALHNFGSLDCRISFSPCSRCPALHLSRCGAGHVEAPKGGLLDSPRAPHGPRVPCNAHGFKPRLSTEGHAIHNKQTHRLEKPVTKQQRSHKLSKENNSSARAKLSAHGPHTILPHRNYSVLSAMTRARHTQTNNNTTTTFVAAQGSGPCLIPP